VHQPQDLSYIATGRVIPRRAAQTGIDGAARPDGRSADTQGPGGSPANHLDQGRIAHPLGQKTAKAISASNTDAEST